MPKKILIALVPAMLEQIDFAAQCEHRTRSDLVREALRLYLQEFKRNQSAPPPPVPLRSSFFTDESRNDK